MLLRCKSLDPPTSQMGVFTQPGSIATDEVEVTRSRMSASPLKADNFTPSQQVRLVPEGDIHSALRI